MTDLHELLAHAARLAADYRQAAGEAPVFPSSVDLAAVRAAVADLPDGPTPPGDVIDQLVAAVTPALVATTGPRYFGFVVGGALDAATAADVLTTAWDQPAFNAVTSPGAAVIEEVVGAWLKDLLCLPAVASFGLVTGGQGANTVGLAAARHHVLAAAGWDVERQGLAGGPPVRVVANRERHATVDRTLRLLGLGAGVLEEVRCDDADTDRVIAAVQRSGECWMGATTWHGRRLMRISVSSWRTTEADVERSVAAIATVLR